MTVHSIQPVILCGGSGSRLWPLSRTGFPKQFLCITGRESLLQLAVARLARLNSEDISTTAPLIVTNEEHRFIALEQLREIGAETAGIILEPTARNTSPALTLAALQALETGDDPILVVTPADQTVTDAPAWTQAMQSAIREAAKGSIVILGIVPDRPETGYGYVQAEPAIQQNAAMKVRRFVEKPDSIRAQNYLEAGGYYWNAGIFVLKASVWMAALNLFRPDIAQTTHTAWLKRNTDRLFIRPGQAEFDAIPAESIDYAVMEYCPDSPFPIAMVPLNAGWNDLGSWDAVWNVLPKDKAGNTYLGDIFAADSSNTLVYATSRLVSVVGVQGLVVIETPDAVLVADKSRSQDVKFVVNELYQQKREEHALHRKVHRPWGWYDIIDEGQRFKVKRIQVKPKASLSLQKHQHRAEHWVVVKGTAEITCGDKVTLIGENQSTYIPLGEVHRLANPGASLLEIIEVQSGTYLGEDDIVRFEDHYDRSDA